MNIRDAFLSTGEAAQALNVSRSTISRKFDLGVLQGKVNPLTGERLISRESLLVFMEQHKLPIEHSLGSGKRILVGTPDSSLRDAVRAAIAGENRLTLSESEYGSDTLVSCSTEQPDVLVLSDSFPDISAHDIIQSLRRRSLTKPLRLMVCLQSATPEQAASWGADVCLAQSEWSNIPGLRQRIMNQAGLEAVGTEPALPFHHERRWARMNVNFVAKAGIYRLNAPRQHSWGTAVIRNISQGGAFLSPISFEGGAFPTEPFRLVLEVDQPSLPQWRAFCQLVRLQSNGHLTAGVQFVRLSHSDRAKIEALEMAHLAPPPPPVAVSA
jgi:CheY-like chemotaxis protein